MSAVLYGPHLTREQDLRIGRQLDAWWTRLHPLRGRVQLTVDGQAANATVVTPPQIVETGVAAPEEDDPFAYDKWITPDEAQWRLNRAAMVRAIMSSGGVSTED